MQDATPTYDRCPHCGREGRAMTSADNLNAYIGSGNRVLPIGGLEEEIATHVGAVILKAGELDAAMLGLVAIAGQPDSSTINSTWGQSGTDLTRALRKIAASADVDAGFAEEMTHLCMRYDALYKIRNDLIHSFRPGRGTERLDVIRAIRIKKGKPPTGANDMSQRRRLGLGELVDLYYAIDDLIHDARNFYFRVLGAI